MAGSGRARRFRQAREMKQGGREDICTSCHANLTLGEVHDLDCDRAPKEWDDLDEENDDEEDEEEDW